MSATKLDTVSSGASTCNWLLPPSERARVCVVIDRSPGAAAISATVACFTAMPEVALLQIDDPVDAHRAWRESLMPGNGSNAAKTGADCQLSRLPRGVPLLVWSTRPQDLDWLGGIEGNKVGALVTFEGDEAEMQVSRLLTLVLKALKHAIAENLLIY
ncbi:hypothetical protein LGM42_24145 [Burkholderia sp. AU39826]|uniref:hypothetical protein n=1 Tax=Burkholderia sp. AU39826 TaxID=2879634 RepID=UPI001CF21DEA|nr:hypothetical protein [Burkholderia sp. AU39826]MCA7972960.1 hypothetical protein [Burkholderia sp. AU39826]